LGRLYVSAVQPSARRKLGTYPSLEENATGGGLDGRPSQSGRRSLARIAELENGGKLTMENEFLKKAVDYKRGGEKTFHDRLPPRLLAVSRGGCKVLVCSLPTDSINLDSFLVSLFC